MILLAGHGGSLRSLRVKIGLPCWEGGGAIPLWVEAAAEGSCRNLRLYISGLTDEGEVWEREKRSCK